MFKSYERLSIHDAGAHAGELKASGWSSHDWDSAMKKPARGGLFEVQILGVNLLGWKIWTGSHALLMILKNLKHFLVSPFA